jgi:DNA adenine methylase
LKKKGGLEMTKMLKPPICYFGGKFYMRKQIIERIPHHKCYVEPFFGSGSVFFGKEPSPYEVVNDIYDDLISLFRIIQNTPEMFLLEMNHELYSRKIFQQYKMELVEKRENLTAMQRAVRVYYLLKTSYGGKCECFKTMTKNKPSLLPKDMKKTIMDVHERLRTTIIECLDFRKIIDIYDRKWTWFFLDPPYNVEGAKCYHQYFVEQDFIDLKNACESMEGKFLLTINDDRWIRDLFKGFKIEEVPVRYAVTRGEKKKFHELFITNY